MSDRALGAYRGARANQLVRNEARHIRSKIHEARGSRHDAGVRWPFELLQNALDAGPRPGRDRVEIWVRHEHGSVAFEHDGAYFSLPELAALLSGGSSKEFNSEETTGRFGTGFLVTHVLAPRMSVSGIFTTGPSLERFELVLDRGGDEDSIVANIEACDAAILRATPLAVSDTIPSATFEYASDDVATLEIGLAAFRTAVPYLFATCERLGRVNLQRGGSPPEVWEAEAIQCKVIDDSAIRERAILCRFGGEAVAYRAVQVGSAKDKAPIATAIAVLVQGATGWRVQVPGHDFPRLFCRYPIRSSAFLPLDAILDAPFDVDQERRRILIDKAEVKDLFRSAVTATVQLVSLAFEEAWEDAHRLARAAPSPSSFADREDEEEEAWLTSEMRFLASQLAELPLVTTRDGRGPAVTKAAAAWFADFVDPNPDGTTIERLWPLVDDAEGLYPPVKPLAEAWAAIARGWHDLGIKVNLITLGSLAAHLREQARKLDDLDLRCDRREWLARFLDVVGECWSGRRVSLEMLDRLLPNQDGALLPLKGLKRDIGISSALKDIADALGCEVRSQLLDSRILEIAGEYSLMHVEGVVAAAVPTVMSEDDVLEACVRMLEKRCPKTDRLSESNRPLVLASIALLDYLAAKGEAVAALAGRIPLLAQDGTFARTSSQRKMLPPVAMWSERANAFHHAYPPDRVLAGEYGGTKIVPALVQWGIALPGLLISQAPADPIKDDRLRCLAIEGAESAGIHVQGEEFTQIALLHELIPRCQGREEAAALLGLVLCYAAPEDSAWRKTRVVVGRREGADVPLTVRGALWLADLRARAWVPVRSDEGKMSQVMATPESLRALLDPAWLRGNRDAGELLGSFFGFDALDLQLLGAPDDHARQELRDRLAHLVELADSDPGAFAAVEAELREKRRRASDVARCRGFGLAVQGAVQRALEANGLTVEVVDRGYDFEVSYEDLDDAAARFEVGSYFVEVKATTQGDAKLTPKQAEVASHTADRYVLCVVDLRGVPEERLEGHWTAEDVVPRIHLVPHVGERVFNTWGLVERARSSEVRLRNESALRYAVPPAVWEAGNSMSDWVAAAFSAR